MKNYKFLLFFLIIFSNLFSQQQLWKGYYSYNEITDLSLSSNTLFASCQNAYFNLNKDSGELKTFNTIDGLSGQTISAVYHSPTLNKTIIGYENGLLIVKNDANGAILNLVDIVNKTIPQNIKKINHFMEFEGIIYISCDFGIVQYNLAKLVFGDTYLIGNNGSQIVVKQTAVFEGKIYAATPAFGIRSASITNPNLNDFNQWTALDASSWYGIETFQNGLYAIDFNSNLFKIQNSLLSFQSTLSAFPLDFRACGDYLVTTNTNATVVYNSNLAKILTINSSQITSGNIKLTCATILENFLYIGTKENGIYKTALSNGVTFENILPDGPYKNAIFNLKKSANNLWAVYGGYDKEYDPYRYCCGGLSQFGINKYTKTNGWKLIPYENLLGTKAISSISINPNNENQVFFGSYFSGILKLENDIAVTLYSPTNSGSNGIQSLSTAFLDSRVNSLTFAKNGDLWFANGKVNKPLKVLKSNATFESFDFNNLTTSVVSDDYNTVIVDKNNTKWISSFRNGVIAVNEGLSDKVIVVKDFQNSNSISLKDIRAMAIDNRNKIWMGTSAGLRVISNVDDFLTETEILAESIIILEDDLAQELLFEQFILDIVVDGANNKWVATNTSGVFHFSPDGQKELKHFTTLNSPLPSNNVIDIEIDALTGEVFFVTDKGMISYKGIATEANETLEEVFIYPNPVRPEFSGTVKVSGLLDKAIVKITDIGGNLVHETTSEGGTIEWDTTAFGKYKVSSGVYMVLISAKDGIETKVKKLMIVR